jgi:hypothetical protein
VPKLEVEVKTPAVVAETMPVDDVTSADPSSVQAAAREQILRADLPTPQADATDGGYQSTQRADGSRIQVVGGPEGVDIVQGERPRPVLGGGFGRQ